MPTEEKALPEDSVEELDGDSEDQTVEDTEDGGAIVTFNDQKAEVAATSEFYANIAEEFDETVLNQLAIDMLDLIDIDKDSRSRRVEQYEDALKRTGLGKEAPGGAAFQGASTVVHPILIQSVVDYASRATAELLPPDGPVKVYTPGEDITQARADKAQRKANLMNWQFRTQCKEFKTQLEQLQTQEPLSGSAYMRVVFDTYCKRPVFSFTPLDNVYLPFEATSFYTAERVTLVEDITQAEFEKRMRDGMYITISDLSPPSQAPEASKAEQANEKIEGKSTPATNKDGTRRVYLTQTKVELDDPKNPQKDSPAPYLISIDLTSRRVISIVRNWEEKDEKMEGMYWLVEWPFIPWRGAYSIGLNQLMAGIPAAATGALRALLDSAHINNLPTLLKLKGTNAPGQSESLEITSVTEIQGGVSGDDIRKLIMAVPYNPPSTVLYQLLGLLVESGQALLKTTFDNLSENPDMPATLGLALIEQGMKVSSAIHLRQWTAMDNTISILHRINRMYITDDEIKDDTGTRLAFRSDFEGPLDCIPTADPQVFSDAQRFAQVNLVAQRSVQNPLYNQRKVEELILKHTRIPNAKDLLVPENNPQEMNAVNENVALALGRPVAAFPDQDHLSHIQVLLDFVESPIFGSSQLFAPTYLPNALEHLKQHLAFWYVAEFYKVVSEASGQDIAKMMKTKDPATRVELDKTLAVASGEAVIPKSKEMFGKIPDIVTRAIATIQKYAPAPPVDPTGSVASAQIKAGVDREKIASSERTTAQKVQAQQQSDQVDMSLEQRRELARQQTDTQRDKSETDRAAMREAAQSERTDKELATKEQINKEDNLTALTIAASDNEAGDRAAVSTGTGINPSP